MATMFRNRSVNVHQFAMIPRADIPRSTFNIQTAHKTTFDSGYLIPIYVDEVLPGDTFNLKMTAFARMSTPLYPVMDNIYLDSFFFFVPNRLVWNNWKKFMGEQDNPGDSTSYVIPQVQLPQGSRPTGSIWDYFGIPTDNQTSFGIEVNALYGRAYNLIWNEWFRDENLQNSLSVPKTDGPDIAGLYTLQRRGKRHDYFTSALPWPQKGPSALLPLGSEAPLVVDKSRIGGQWKAYNPLTGSPLANNTQFKTGVGGTGHLVDVATTTIPVAFEPGQQVYADLSLATAATINQLRQAFQIQKLLERDARGGTRYTEIVRAHFGVLSPDARLQRPEYLGGGTTPISINPIAQTGPTGTQGSSTPLGELGAIGTAVAANHGFKQSFTEHGMIIGLISVRADLNYQQGLRKMWSRKTRYDYYFPAFAMLGEQAILNKEIYTTGGTTDEDVFGYQERWAEYRYHPPRITSLMNSKAAQTLDAWHLAQNFTVAPTLNSTFIQENPPMQRILAVGSGASGQEFICDTFFNIKAARPMPMYSVPGLIDHF